MTATSSVASLFLFAIALGPCSDPQPLTSLVGTDAPAPAPQSAGEAPRELPKQQTQTAHAFMRDHANVADELRHAVIAGRFDLIHRTAAVMASDAWSANLRPDYLPHVAAVRHAATAALEARSMSAAGAALGELGAACASCHREQGGPPQPKSEPLADGVGTMAIHAAAEQALWDGLFTPSAAAWKQGAERLAEAPELASDVDDVDALGRELRDLAIEAKAGGPPRADLYGGIMATCSTCHRRLNVEPR